MSITKKHRFILRKAELLSPLLAEPLPYRVETMDEAALAENDKEMDELMHQLGQHPARKYQPELQRIRGSLRSEFGMIRLA